MHELFFSFITNPVHEIRLLLYFSANCVSGLSSASGPNLIYADWKICGDFKGSWIRIEADWWPWTAVKSNLCPPVCSAFPLATAQQLLVGILINPIQLRSNLFSNSANKFMEWPQSQCLQAQVVQRLSAQIRVCRDLWQQISLCQHQEGKINLLPSLGAALLCWPCIIPSWSRAGSALSQDWAMWVPVLGGTRPSSIKPGLFAGYHHLHGVQLLPSTEELLSTTPGELSPKSFPPDFPMAPSAPDREDFALQLTEMPTPQSLSGAFCTAFHFPSARLLRCFFQMITGCSISLFALVLHWHKWAQVLSIPAP